jgi:hypothetical protein
MHPYRQDPVGPGWVYVLTCLDYPACVKISGTSRTPQQRAAELVTEYNTKHAFTVVVAHPAGNWFAAEQMAHRMLSDRRLPRSELFRCSPDEASRVIRAAVSVYEAPSLGKALLRRLLEPRPQRHSTSDWRAAYDRRSPFRWRRSRRSVEGRNAVRGIVAVIILLIGLWWLRAPMRHPSIASETAYINSLLPVQRAHLSPGGPRSYRRSSAARSPTSKDRSGADASSD